MFSLRRVGSLLSVPFGLLSLANCSSAPGVPVEGVGVTDQALRDGDDDDDRRRENECAPEPSHHDRCDGDGAQTLRVRQISPLSTSNVTSRRPHLRWKLASGSTATRVEICGDRACTHVISSFHVSGSRGTPPADLPVGAAFWRVLSQRHGTTTASATWSFYVGARSAPVNASWGTTLDVNGDGYGDFALGAAGIYLGGPAGLPAVPNTLLTMADPKLGFGWTLASAGDVNGDGFGDFVVGAPGPNGGVGALHVYHGSPAGLSATPTTSLVGLTAKGGFGTTAASAGDVNGDGYADVIVGANGSDGGVGRAYVYLGGPSGLAASPATTLLSPDPSHVGFGFTVASAGDVNADGYGDVIIGAPGAIDAMNNHAFIYLGGPCGLSTTPATTLTNAPDAAGGELGWSVGCAGDINGDGYADVAVGAPRVGGLDGSAYVYRGGPSGVSTVPTIISAQAITPQAQQETGFAVASPGDINGDGYSDLVVTATGVDGYTGKAYVFAGSASGLSASPVVTLTGPDGPMSAFGWALSRTGDLNGDGFADVAIGAPWIGGADSLGRGHVYYGGSSWISSTPSLSIVGPTFGSGYVLAN